MRSKVRIGIKGIAGIKFLKIHPETTSLIHPETASLIDPEIASLIHPENASLIYSKPPRQKSNLMISPFPILPAANSSFVMSEKYDFTKRTMPLCATRI